MPSPIAHISMGCFLWFWLRRRMNGVWQTFKMGPVLLFGLFVFFSVAPDLDAVMGIITGDLGKYHNQQSHSLLFGLGVTLLLAAVLAKLFKAVPFRRWVLLMTTGYLTHIIMDWFCYGRGVKLLWPLTNHRFQAPLEIFGGFHWSQGWWHPRHLYTAAEELLFGLLLFAVSWWFLYLRRLAGSER